MSPKERVTASIESRTSVVEPIEIFPGPQEIPKPTFKKTRLMRYVEEAVQEDLRVFLLRAYSVEGLSQDDISQVIRDINEGYIQIRAAVIGHWLKRFNILVRSRSEGIKLAWQNPEKREHQIERMREGIHSSAVSRKRSKATRRYWENLSEAERENRLRAVRETRRVAMLNHMRDKLGEDPTERLRGLCERLTLKEIGGEHGIPPSTVGGWKKSLGIETRKPGKSTQGIGFIKADEERKQNLVKEARMHGIIIILDPKEQFVINARFPTEGTTVPLTQIGRNLDPNRPAQFSKEYIRQIQEKALRKLANGAK